MLLPETGSDKQLFKYPLLKFVLLKGAANDTMVYVR